MPFGMGALGQLRATLDEWTKDYKASADVPFPDLYLSGCVSRFFLSDPEN